MERKIGEIFEYNGEWYQCVTGRYCDDCAFRNDNCEERERITSKEKLTKEETTGLCVSKWRSDCKSVIFRKLEKVGEPFSCNYYGDGRLVMMQEYQLFAENVIYCYQTPPMYITDYKHKRIAIEIKQNKEDMSNTETLWYGPDKKEAKSLKLSNLKPFSLEAAKQGKTICTRDGRKARIICFDAEGNKPLIVLSKIDGKEVILRYTEKGQSDNFHSPTPREDDLMMLPEKKEGWVKIRKDINLYNTKEDADRKMIGNDEYVTAKVCLEE